MRNSCSASTETRLFVPPNTLNRAECTRQSASYRSACADPDIGAYPVHHPVVGVSPLPVDTKLSVVLALLAVRTTPGVS